MYVLIGKTHKNMKMEDGAYYGGAMNGGEH